MAPQNINRRDFLRGAGVGAALLLGSNLKLLGQHPSLFSTTTGLNVPAGHAQLEPFVPDAEISITALQKSVQILSGAPTTVWSYEGQLFSGSGVTVQNLPGILPRPDPARAERQESAHLLPQQPGRGQCHSSAWLARARGLRWAADAGDRTGPDQRSMNSR